MPQVTFHWHKQFCDIKLEKAIKDVQENGMPLWEASNKYRILKILLMVQNSNIALKEAALDISFS